MKTFKIACAMLAMTLTIPAFAGTPKKEVIPIKGKSSNPVGSPKAPAQTHIYVTYGETADELDFEMSPNIQFVYVVLTSDNTGEIQTGSVDQTNHVMTATLTEGTTYTLTCTTDAGMEFETTIEP